MPSVEPIWARNCKFRGVNGVRRGREGNNGGLGRSGVVGALDDSLFCFLADFATGGDWGAIEGLIGRFRVFLLLSG